MCCMGLLFTLSLTAVPARPADSLVDAIGVNIHLTYGDTTYGKYEEIIRPRLKELGIRHLRDGATDRADFVAKVRELAASGMHFCLIMDPRGHRDRPGPPTWAPAIVEKLGDAVVAVEGPNEMDTTGESWPARLAEFQKALYEQMKSRPSTARVPVLGPSLANTRDGPGKLGDLRAAMDFGNMHSYSGGNAVGSPQGGGWGISFEQAVREQRKVCGPKPIIATETGYHNNLKRGLHPGVSERASGKYLPRLHFMYFNRGIERTYSYEFADLFRDDDMTDMERHFGLIRWDGTPKPAFAALRNLIRTLSDPGPAFTPESLDYRLEGDLRDVQQTLLQKRDGRFYLVLWQEVGVFDTSRKEDIANPDREVKLKLAGPAERIRLYRPNASPDPVGEPVGGAREMGLAVPDELLIVEIVSRKERS